MFFSSCSKELEIALPPIKIMPVVNCIFTPGKPFMVALELPSLPTDTTITFITNAEVTVFGDNGTSYLLAHLEKGKYSNPAAVAEAGVSYKLKAKTDNYPLVSAEDKIPLTNTRIENYSIKKRDDDDPINGSSEGKEHSYYNIALSIASDPSVKDYMGVSVVENRINARYSNGTVSYEVEENKYRQGYIKSDDLVITTEGLGSFDDQSTLFFRDHLFKADKEIVNVKVFTQFAKKFWVRFYTFSPSCYQYLKTWNIHDNTRSFDFWEIYEPLSVFSNIENGYGIFAGYSAIDQILTVEEQTN